MSAVKKTFRDKLREARPDMVKHQRQNEIKAAIAKKLRALRDTRGLTQADVARAAGMTQSMIARIESLSGPEPTLDSINRYVEACGGKMRVEISSESGRAVA